MPLRGLLQLIMHYLERNAYHPVEHLSAHATEGKQEYVR